MVTRRDGLNAAEAGVLGPSCQHNMAVQPIRSRCDLREGHAYLESNPGLLWNDAHRSESTNDGNYLVEKCSDFRPLAFEMMFQIMSCARMRLVAICEISTALLTLPKGTIFHAGEWAASCNKSTRLRGDRQLVGLVLTLSLKS